MPIDINGSGTITGLSVGGLNDGVITPSELSTGAPTWDSQGNLGSIASINGGPLAGLKNKIINGAMDVSQRGTTFTAIGTGYTLDRFRWVSSGAMVVNVNQSTVVPNNTFEYSLHVDVTTADTSIGSSDFAYIEHGIEGFNSRDLIGSTFTVSFWVRSPKTGTHCVSIRGAGGINYYVATYSISSANTWEYKSFTVTGGLPNDGSWDKKSNLGMSVSFVLAMGSLYHTATPNSWQSGNLFSTSAQVNCVDSATNDFYITGIQVEAGPVATPFERRPIGTELALCYRYYIQLAESDLMGGANQRRYASSGGVVWQAGGAIFPSTMRATPNASTSGTVTYSNASGLAYAVTPRSVRTEVAPTAAGIYTWGGGATHIFDAEL